LTCLTVSEQDLDLLMIIAIEELNQLQYYL